MAFEVEGISAVMIYANEPQRLADWYAQHLGIVTRHEPGDGNWYGDIGDPASGQVVHFGIYPAREPLPVPRSVMVNYRVRDLSAALTALRGAGVEIESTVEESYGHFAYLRDPEGNPIELYSARPAPS